MIAADDKLCEIKNGIIAVGAMPLSGANGYYGLLREGKPVGFSRYNGSLQVKCTFGRRNATSFVFDDGQGTLAGMDAADVKPNMRVDPFVEVEGLYFHPNGTFGVSARLVYAVVYPEPPVETEEGECVE